MYLHYLQQKLNSPFIRLMLRSNYMKCKIKRYMKMHIKRPDPAVPLHTLLGMCSCPARATLRLWDICWLGGDGKEQEAPACTAP